MSRITTMAEVLRRNTERLEREKSERHAEQLATEILRLVRELTRVG